VKHTQLLRERGGTCSLPEVGGGRAMPRGGTGEGVRRGEREREWPSPASPPPLSASSRARPKFGRDSWGSTPGRVRMLVQTRTGQVGFGKNSDETGRVLVSGALPKAGLEPRGGRAPRHRHCPHRLGPGLPPPLSISLSVSLFLPVSLDLSLSHTHTHSVSLCFSLSHTHSVCLSLFLSLFLSLLTRYGGWVSWCMA